jgi:hypothetical protein
VLVKRQGFFQRQLRQKAPMEFLRPPEKRTITPEKAVRILAKHGTFITPEKAKLMLDFLYRIGNLSVSEALKRVKKPQKRRLRRIKNFYNTKTEHRENC